MITISELIDDLISEKYLSILLTKDKLNDDLRISATVNDTSIFKMESIDSKLIDNTYYEKLKDYLSNHESGSVVEETIALDITAYKQCFTLGGVDFHSLEVKANGSSKIRLMLSRKDMHSIIFDRISLDHKDLWLDKAKSSTNGIFLLAKDSGSMSDSLVRAMAECAGITRCIVEHTHLGMSVEELIKLSLNEKVLIGINSGSVDGAISMATNILEIPRERIVNSILIKRIIDVNDNQLFIDEYIQDDYTSRKIREKGLELHEDDVISKNIFEKHFGYM